MNSNKYVLIKSNREGERVRPACIFGILESNDMKMKYCYYTSMEVSAVDVKR